MAGVPVRGLLESVTGAQEHLLRPDAGRRGWKPIRAPSPLNPQGKVIVGLPLVSRGQVNFSSLASTSGSSSFSSSNLGAPSLIAGISTRSTFWNKRTSSPLNLSRSMLERAIVNGSALRPASMKPESVGPYSALRAG